LLAATIAAKSYIPPQSKIVIYEANLRALGPKVGFQALTQRLDPIKALGVNVLWLMPIYPVGKERSAGGLGSPYAVADLSKVNPEFGTSAEFRNLVSQAHKRNMAVILDWVPNHTSWDHPWVKQHPDWYTKDAQGKITIPAGTNWQDVADLNYDNREMRRAMIDSMKGWLQNYGVDGFRVDTADYVPFDFWKEAVPALRRSVSRPIFMLAEGFRPDHYKAGFDLTFGWPFFDGLLKIYKGAKASSLAEDVAREEKDIPPGARRLRFTTNHDKAAWEGTTLDFFKTREGARGAFAAVALHGGAPLIYSGQEVAHEARIPIFDHSVIDWTKNPDEGKWIGQVLKLRNSNSAFTEGKLKDFSSDDVIAFSKKKGAATAIVLVNVRDRTVSIPIPADLRQNWKNGLTGAKVKLSEKVDLTPYGLKILVK
jgi:glycosidase